MKPEEMKRIAEIIGWIAHLEDGGVKLISNKGLWEAGYFEPHTNWAHTGMLLEWLYSKYVVAHGMMEDGGCYWVLRSEDTLATGEGETLQLAICNAVLTAGRK